MWNRPPRKSLRLVVRLVRDDNVRVPVLLGHTLGNTLPRQIRFGSPGFCRGRGNIPGEPQGVLGARVNLFETPGVLHRECDGYTGSKSVLGANPLAHRVVDMRGSVSSSGSSPVIWCQDLVVTETRDVPSCIQHLYNFEKNLDDVLVAIESCTLIWIQGQKKYIHFGLGPGPGPLRKPMLSWDFFFHEVHKVTKVHVRVRVKVVDDTLVKVIKVVVVRRVPVAVHVALDGYTRL